MTALRPWKRFRRWRDDPWRPSLRWHVHMKWGRLLDKLWDLTHR